MSVYHEAPTEATTPAPTGDPDITHLVCGCQVDATPRLALCLADCSDVPVRIGVVETFCIVCHSLSHVARFVGCEFCRDHRWANL